MRIFKLAIISVIVMFIILTAMSALLPSKVLVSRAVDIRGSVSKTKEQAFQLQNWKNWLTDAKGQQAEHIYNASTLKIGEVSITPVSTTDSSFATSWKPGDNITSTIRIIDHHSADSLITVQWQMEQKISWYPWEKFASITRDETWGGSMEKSLDNLKNRIEARQ